MSYAEYALARSAKNRPASRLRPLIIIPIVLTVAAFDTVVFPGALTGTFDKIRYATVSSRLHVGQTRGQAESAFRAGFAKPKFGAANTTGAPSSMETDFLPSHTFCTADILTLHVDFDQTNHVSKISTIEDGQSC